MGAPLKDHVRPGLCNLVVAHRKRLWASPFLTVLKAIISFPYLNDDPVSHCQRRLPRARAAKQAAESEKNWLNRKKFLRFFLGLITKRPSR